MDKDRDSIFRSLKKESEDKLSSLRKEDDDRLRSFRKQNDDMLKSFRMQNNKVLGTIRISDSPTVKKALEIMKDFDDKKVRLLPPTNSRQQAIHEKFAYIFLNLERNKKRSPFSELFARLIIDSYKQAETLRMIENIIDPEKEALKTENIQLRQRLEDMEKLDKPNDSLTGDVIE